MEDFIFGTLATDPLKLNYHRTTRSGIQHAFEMIPQAPTPDEPVRLIAHTGPDVHIEYLAAYVTFDGSNPTGSRGQAAHGSAIHFTPTATTWDTLTWGYTRRWEAKIPAQPAGTVVRYIISGWTEEGEEIFADYPDVKLTIEHMAKYYFDGQEIPELTFWGDPQKAQIFNFLVENYRPPQWSKEAVFYHIFVDRFYPGNGQDWLQTNDLRAPFGGTLWGIIEKLDYINSLGATTLWLSPIFPSPTVHRYDAMDYTHVADELGGDAALVSLVTEAHRRGIKVILDLVCNHISDQHPYFKAALADPQSPYRHWFFFDEAEETGYRSFFEVPSMPQVNLDHPDARQWMLDIAHYWLSEFKVDGYRLDHATGPGPGFWAEFRQVCKQTNPECLCLGEVVEPPNIQMRYHGRMDGLLDFHLCEAIRRRIGLEVWPEDRFENFLARHQAYFPEGLLMASFLDNHDTDRFLYIANNDPIKLKQAATLQFSLPGPPIIYYGTEVGLEQHLSKTSAVGLEASRGKMAWGADQDRDLLQFYRDLIKRRKVEKPWQTAA